MVVEEAILPSVISARAHHRLPMWALVIVGAGCGQTMYVGSDRREAGTVEVDADHVTDADARDGDDGLDGDEASVEVDAEHATDADARDGDDGLDGDHPVDSGTCPPHCVGLCDDGTSWTVLDSTSIGTAEAPLSVSLGDWNEDGLMDLMALGGLDPIMTFDRNLGLRSFSPMPDLVLEDPAVTARLSDFDRDSIVDIVVALSEVGAFDVYYGMEGGAFGNRTRYLTSLWNPADIEAVDLNRDGLVDVVLLDPGGSLGVFIDSGDGDFTHVDWYITDSGSNGVAVDDLNGDGFVDIATANLGSITIDLSYGDGTFYGSGLYDLHPGGEALSPLIVDLDGDHLPDICVVEEFENTLTIISNRGDGTFNIPNSYDTRERPVALSAADFDLDGDVDVAVASAGSGDVAIHLNDGDGVLDLHHSVPVGMSLSSIRNHDFDGDGSIDLVVTDILSNTVTVLWTGCE